VHRVANHGRDSLAIQRLIENRRKQLVNRGFFDKSPGLRATPLKPLFGVPGSQQRFTNREGYAINRGQRTISFAVEPIDGCFNEEMVL
jgi:hypothetical protein